MTNSTGVKQFESDYYPQGGQRVITATKDSLLKFQAKQLDTESGLENAARLYSSATGRFLSVAAKPAIKTPQPQALNKVSAPAAKPLNKTTSSIAAILLALRAALSQYRQCARNVETLFGDSDFLGDFGDAASWVEIICGLPDIDLLALLGGDCKERTQPGPFPAPFEPCANNGFEFAGPSWQCTGDRNCCLGKEQVFTDACEAKKGLNGQTSGSLFGDLEAACCKRKK
jgi:hypothetical protein